MDIILILAVIIVFSAMFGAVIMVLYAIWMDRITKDDKSITEDDMDEIVDYLRK